MKPLILDEFGSRLSVSHFRLVANGQEFEARRFPFDSIFLLTHAFSISGEALRFLWSANVPLFVIDWHGSLQTSILHKSAFKPQLRLAQYTLTETRKQEIVDKIVKDKVRKMERLLAEAGHPADLGETELQAAKKYWTRFGKVVRGLGYDWSGRKNLEGKNWRATSIPNSLCNFGYSILQAVVRTEINLAGLDESFGFLHRNYPHSEPLAQPLVFDLMESFRPDVDSCVLQILRSKPKVTERDFERNADDYTLRLKPELARRMIQTIQENLDHLRVRAYVREFSRQVEGQGLQDTRHPKVLPQTRGLPSPEESDWQIEGR